MWDEKTAELAGLAEQYSGALEEQKKLFGKLKLVVQEKDQIIAELNRQIFMREQSQETHFEQMKMEMLAQSRLMQDEVLATVALLEQKCAVKDSRLLEEEKEKKSCITEFTKVLEERNFFEQELATVSDRLKFQMAELEHTQQTLKEQNDIYGDLLNIRSISIGKNTIEHALRNLKEDSKRYSAEMV